MNPFHSPPPALLLLIGLLALTAATTVVCRASSDPTAHDSFHFVDLTNLSPSTASITVSEQTLYLYEPVEFLTAAGTEAVGNPFDYELNNVSVLITFPNKQSKRFYAFYFQQQARSLVNGSEVITPVGKPNYHTRFTPTIVGQHTFCFEIVHSGVPQPGSCTQINVVDRPSDLSHRLPRLRGVGGGSNRPSSDRDSLLQLRSRGFIRVGKNGQHFDYSDTHRTWFGVGQNVAWSDNRGTFAYDEYFAKMSQHGENAARLWLTDPWSLFFLETKLGKYDLANAWRIDYVVELARRTAIDMKLIMCIESFNLLCTWAGPCNWPEFVYNRANGGPIARPEDFFTDPTAQKLFWNRMRYIVARFGYATSVLSWELFNEVDITDNFNDTAHVRWADAASTFLHEIDPNQHMVTTSTSHTDFADVWNLRHIDYVQVHSYGDYDGENLGKNNRYWATRLGNEYRGKPSYIGEYSLFSQGPPNEMDPKGINLHTGMWASALSMSASASMSWWWDNYIGPLDLYPLFVGLSRFTHTIEWVNFRWQNVSSVSTAGDASLFTYATAGRAVSDTPAAADDDSAPFTAIVLWVQNANFTWYAASQNFTCAPLTDVIVAVFADPCEDKRVYEWTCVDTATAEVVFTDVAICGADRKTVTMRIPDLTCDVACVGYAL